MSQDVDQKLGAGSWRFGRYFLFLAPFMLSVFNEFPPKSDSQFLRKGDGKIFQTRNS
jgi:hypothetical protein